MRCRKPTLRLSKAVIFPSAQGIRIALNVSLAVVRELEHLAIESVGRLTCANEGFVVCLDFDHRARCDFAIAIERWFQEL